MRVFTAVGRIFRSVGAAAFWTGPLWGFPCALLMHKVLGTPIEFTLVVGVIAMPIVVSILLHIAGHLLARFGRVRWIRRRRTSRRNYQFGRRAKKKTQPDQVEQPDGRPAAEPVQVATARKRTVQPATHL